MTSAEGCEPPSPGSCPVTRSPHQGQQGQGKQVERTSAATTAQEAGNSRKPVSAGDKPEARENESISRSDTGHF